MSLKEENERDELIHKTIVDRYDLEFKRTNDLDSKASSVILFAGILATLTTGVTEILPESPYKFLLSIPLTLFILSTIFGLLAYWILDFQAMNPKTLIQRYAEKTKTETLRASASTISEMTMLNYLFNQRKVKWIYRAFFMLVLAIVLFFVFSIVIIMT